MLCYENRPLSKPFISGDDFRAIADFIYDETDSSLDPREVRPGDIIFLGPNHPEETDSPKTMRKFFFEVHPQINNSYILITHNSDYGAPNEFVDCLNDEKIFMWFAENPDILSHPKLVPIPIGLPKAHYGLCYPEFIEKTKSMRIPKTKSRRNVYCNFSVTNNFQERGVVFEHFKEKNFCFFSQRKPLFDYLQELARFPFAISPHGLGLDCHRTWEALALGVIPIVKTSTLDPLYIDLPVIIVNEWKDVTPSLLQKELKKIQSTRQNLEKLYFAYWETLVLEAQKKCRSESKTSS